MSILSLATLAAETARARDCAQQWPVCRGIMHCSTSVRHAAASRPPPLDTCGHSTHTCVPPTVSQGPGSHARRDDMLRWQEESQRKWREAKVFEEDAPAEGAARFPASTCGTRIILLCRRMCATASLKAMSPAIRRDMWTTCLQRLLFSVGCWRRSDRWKLLPQAMAGRTKSSSAPSPTPT